MTRRVLLVDDDAEVREALGQTLELADLDATCCGSFIEAKDHLIADFDGVVLTDIRMPGRDGFHLLDYATGLDPELPVILLTGEGDVPMAVRAMQAGAHEFLEKPCAPKELIAVLEKALARRVEVLSARRQKLEIESGDAAARMIFGVSRLSEALRARVRTVARSSGEVLVTGETGSGTPKIAEIIHMLSAASRHPFVKRSAGQLDPEALGAAFDEALAGSIYLDEVWALGPATQFALLDRLEGGGPRIIAGTTRSLEDEVAAGRFNGDLFYRLDLLRVRIPSLNERTEDIPVMFRRYVAQACEQANLPEPEITPGTIGALLARDWPGNARALMSEAMRFAMGVGEGGDAGQQGMGLAERMAQFERSLLMEALQSSGGRATAAAEALKLPRKTFYDKLARYDIKPEAFRRAPMDGSLT